MLGAVGVVLAAGTGGLVLYVLGGHAPTPMRDATLVMVERDVPQTRNFDPIVNHEAMVVNISPAPVVVDIVSPIPEGFNVAGKFYPAFENESLLGVPIESPFDLKIDKYQVLGKPEIVTEGARTEFVWRRVRIGPNEAAVAQYDNYFGPRDRFSTEYGVSVADLDVRCSYSVETRGHEATFKLDYRLRNLGRHPLEYLMVGVFLPDTVLAESGEQQLVRVAEVSAPPSVDVDRTSMSDGLGRMAQGSDFYIREKELPPGKEIACSLRVRGTVTGSGDIYPLMTIQAKSEGDRLWPETRLVRESPIELKTFYYRHLSLVIPDPHHFRVEPDGTISTHR